MPQVLDKLLTLTQKNLNKETVRYLKSRGITKETAIKWKIGYLPSQSLLLDLEEIEPLYETGILLRKINKSPLHEYVTFPMYNQYGEIIGFSGRPPLDNDEVKKRGLKKYWHSKFAKRSFLFGLNFAIESARELNYIVVTEGQFDSIICSQNGIENVVSTCGTALTQQQVILLSRYVDKAYVVFDTDEAGKRAFDQLKKHSNEKIELIPVYLPDSTDDEGNLIKEDPDSYIRKFGKEEFLKCIMTPPQDQTHTP